MISFMSEIGDPDEYVLGKLEDLIKDEDDAALEYSRIANAYIRRGKPKDLVLARAWLLLSHQERMHKRFIEKYRVRR